MTIDFDPGYTSEPFVSLCKDFASAAYPKDDFRLEWGPIFHRGRLDGSARLLVIGQDPAAQECDVRRILVGTAGHRVQGFMAKLGITKSYVMINTFAFGVATQTGGEKHKSTPSIVDYRNRWFSGVLASGRVEAVVAFGSLAQDAWTRYLKTAPGAAHAGLPFQHVLHPTSPANQADQKATTKPMLAQWNGAITVLRPKLETDAPPQSSPYGDDFKPEELPAIPPGDLPAGTPSWMTGADGWASRVGATSVDKRRTLQVVVPDGFAIGS